MGRCKERPNKGENPGGGIRSKRGIPIYIYLLISQAQWSSEPTPSETAKSQSYPLRHTQPCLQVPSSTLPLRFNRNKTFLPLTTQRWRRSPNLRFLLTTSHSFPFFFLFNSQNAIRLVSLVDVWSHLCCQDDDAPVVEDVKDDADDDEDDEDDDDDDKEDDAQGAPLFHCVFHCFYVLT